MIDVSIIIPAYNRLWSLPKAVSSCKETNLAVEIIVVDDGSTDGTAAWLSGQDSVVAVHQDNLGKDWAVNAAFQLSTGKYIRFLDADDWILPYSTDLLVEQALKNDSHIVCAGYQVVGEEEEKVIKNIPWTVCDDFLAQQLGECDSSHYSAYLFKRDFINDIPHRQEYGALDDRQFVIEAALKNPKVAYIDQLTLAHRVHSNDRLQKVSGLKLGVNHDAHLMIYKKCLKRLTDQGQLTQRRKNAAINILWPLATWVAQTHLKDAQDIYLWITKLNPDFKMPARGLKGFLYKCLGFALTQKVLRVGRFVKHGWQ